MGPALRVGYQLRTLLARELVRVSADQAIRLVGVLIWPAVLVFFLILIRGSLRNFISDIGEFTLRTPVGEATAKRREKAAAALGAAEAKRAPVGDLSRTGVDPEDVAEVLPNSRVMRRLQGSRILWVDDRPDNNIFERQALEALGINIDLATSTEEAMQLVQRRSYDLIISDMGRPSDERAGYTLLRQLREGGNNAPFVIYSGSRAPEHVREARRRGAIGSTNSPQELVSIVTRALADRNRD